MKLNIKPSEETSIGYNCMESNVNDILKWKAIDCEKSLIGSWKFRIVRDDNIEAVGDRLYTATLAEIAQRYKKYCGIDFKEYSKETTKDPFGIIESEISSKRPLLIFYDTYNCPWFIHYHKQHSEHFCTVVGIDETNVYCIDSEPVEKNGVIKREEFYEGYKSIITLEFYDAHYEYSDLKAVLSECVSGLSDSTFDDMRYFADCFNNMNLCIETKGLSDVYVIPIYYKVLGIYGSRYQFGKFIEYLMKFFDEDILKYLSSRFTEISFQWASIKALTCKAIAANSEKILPLISERIRKVTEKEETTAKRINDYINNSFIYEPEKMSEAAQNENFVFIDLTKYFNSKGFEGKNAGFPKSGQYFLTEGLPEGPVWTTGKEKFLFPDVKNFGYDNISCQAQVIKCQNGVFSCVMFLCTAEWGSFIENIVINYKDGTHETKEFAVSNWSGEPEFQETVMWSGRTANKNEIFSGKYSIYAKTLRINKERKIIESVILPDFENMHIFAVTFS